MESEYIEDLQRLRESNFWFMAKKKYLDLLIEKPGSLILDVGCGAGQTMASFIAQGCKVLGVDNNKRALDFCREKGYKVFQANLETEGMPEIQCTPDYITLFDFIEHVQCPIKVLSHLRKISSPDTQLFVTVPSYRFLFGAWDKAMGHVKRYNRSMLCSELERAGWKVSRSTYIHFVPLIPALVLRKIIKPLLQRIWPEFKSRKEKFYNPGLLLSRLIYCLYYPEFFWFRCGLPVPFGLSVLAIATPEEDVV